jgi:hypothetical protein
MYIDMDFLYYVETGGLLGTGRRWRICILIDLYIIEFECRPKHGYPSISRFSSANSTTEYG